MLVRYRATLLMLPSTAVRLQDGAVVAWAFMGESVPILIAVLELTNASSTCQGLTGQSYRSMSRLVVNHSSSAAKRLN